MSSDESITHWVTLLKEGNLSAAQPLWERYFASLVRLARSRLPQAGDVDGEDVALSAFASMCLGAAAGRFPQLTDRDDLWRLLIFITAQKIAEELRRRNTLKRGARLERVDETVLAQVIGDEPTPEFTVMVAEQVQHLLDRLDNDQLRQVALWKMEGHTNQEISQRLGCALRTVANKLELIRTLLQSESC
jgi:DNA-directed RNA polymerase specialized sigma24 family protein